jgi:hypothetical protein
MQIFARPPGCCLFYKEEKEKEGTHKYRVNFFGDTGCITIHNFRTILSRVLVTTEGVRIGKWIY